MQAHAGDGEFEIIEVVLERPNRLAVRNPTQADPVAYEQFVSNPTASTTAPSCAVTISPGSDG